MLHRFLAAHRWHLPLVLLVCALVYWPLLGRPGFGATEGHRVAPAWHMLESGDFWRLELFGQTYLRKPPGMPWAVAASTAILGHTEFAARAVSAAASTLMALVAFVFATRWFGRPYGLAAGLAQALTPVFWLSGRVAEIEPLNALGTQLGAFALLDLVLRPPHASAPARPVTLGMIAVGSLGLVIAVLAKGPAGLAALGALLAGVCIAARSARLLLRPALLISLGLAAGVLGAITLRLAAANPTDGAVTQDFSEFTWASATLLKWLWMPIGAFMATWPASFSLVFPFGADARREASPTPPTPPTPDSPLDRGFLAAQSLALAWLLHLAFLLALGVTNPRYVFPGAVFLAPQLAYMARGIALSAPSAFTRTRRLIARVFTLWLPAVYPVLMLLLALSWIAYNAARANRNEGRDAGFQLATTLPDGAELWASDLVEARPDVLLYARLYAAREHIRLTPRWMREEIFAGDLPDTTPGAPRFLLLRADDGSNEEDRYRSHIRSGRLTRIWTWRVAKYSFTLYQTGPAAPPAGTPPRSP